MGLIQWWSKWRQDFHTPRESDKDLLRRIANVPPELWSGADRMASRRLRYQREVELRKAIKMHLNLVPIMRKYPEGPFWPRTPAPNNEYYREYKRQRRLEQIADHPDVAIGLTEDGQLALFDMYTGELLEYQ
ncbi:hypothetical protein FQN57_005006 [Myotisia sp. PD_48]|nr:hypothetical protein FQN57_005006 [Myotisia sp. PD_48]